MPSASLMDDPFGGDWLTAEDLEAGRQRLLGLREQLVTLGSHRSFTPFEQMASLNRARR